MNLESFDAMKGYLIANVDVQNPEAYEAYRSRTAEIVARHDGRFLVRGGRIEIREGMPAIHRLVILEFPSIEQARIFYDSDDYQAILPDRTNNAVSNVFLVEGCPPQA